MEIGALTSPLAATDTQAAGSNTGIAGDFNTFLTLLTTQLQNQDPLEPTDTNEFTRQLVSFAGVEQQIQANQKLDNLADLTAFNQVNAAVDFIGREATIAGNTGRHDGSGIDFAYELPKAADTARVEVLDSSGDVVFSENAPTGAGGHDFPWPGLTNSGVLAEPGQYSFRVVARDNEGGAISTNTFVTGPVTEVTTSGGQPSLTVAGQQVSLEDILSVRSPRG